MQRIHQYNPQEISAVDARVHCSNSLRTVITGQCRQPRPHAVLKMRPHAGCIVAAGYRSAWAAVPTWARRMELDWM